MTLMVIDNVLANADRIDGFLHGIVTKVNLTGLYKQKKLFKTYCCDKEIFSRSQRLKCSTCSEIRVGKLNVAVVGNSVDANSDRLDRSWTKPAI